jgi:hypothetical protein
MAVTIQPQIRTLGPPVNSRQVPKLMLREESTATAVKQNAKDMKPGARTQVSQNDARG